MIQDFKDEFEKKLPPEEDVINRNKRISSVYAQYYLENKTYSNGLGWLLLHLIILV